MLLQAVLGYMLTSCARKVREAAVMQDCVPAVCGQGPLACYAAAPAARLWSRKTSMPLKTRSPLKTRVPLLQMGMCEGTPAAHSVSLPCSQLASLPSSLLPPFPFPKRCCSLLTFDVSDRWAIRLAGRHEHNMPCTPSCSHAPFLWACAPSCSFTH